MITTVNILGLGWVGKALKTRLESLNYRVTCNNPDENASCTIITWPAPAVNQIASLPKFNHPVFALSSIGRSEHQLDYETKVQAHFQLCYILRLGGLIGYDRHPGKFLAGRTDLDGAYHSTNLIHRDDVIQILCLMVKQFPKDKIYHLVCDHHPAKKDFYQQAAQFGGFQLPQFKQDFSFKASVSNQALKDEYQYRFIYPSPLDYLKVLGKR